jgi:hypothetical protein
VRDVSLCIDTRTGVSLKAILDIHFVIFNIFNPVDKFGIMDNIEFDAWYRVWMIISVCQDGIGFPK